MIWAAVLVVVVLLPLTVWGIISPRHQWWVLFSWQYRHPDKVEASDASYLLMRLANVLMLLIIAGGAILLLSRQLDDRRTASCEQELLPAVEALGEDPEEVDLEPIAEQHGLELRAGELVMGEGVMRTLELHDGGRHVLTVRAGDATPDAVTGAVCH